MTKQIVAALALVVGTTGALSAQASTISANASVSQAVYATGLEQDVVFPAGTPGGTGGVAVTAAATALNAAGPQLGFVEYALNYSGPDVTVSATPMTDGTNTLAVTFTCGESNAAGTGLALAACGSHDLTYNGGGVETRRVWVGGSISQAAIDAAVPGAYQSTVTITLNP